MDDKTKVVSAHPSNEFEHIQNIQKLHIPSETCRNGINEINFGPYLMKSGHLSKYLSY